MKALLIINVINILGARYCLSHKFIRNGSRNLLKTCSYDATCSMRYTGLEKVWYPICTPLTDSLPIFFIYNRSAPKIILCIMHCCFKICLYFVCKYFHLECNLFSCPASISLHVSAVHDRYYLLSCQNCSTLWSCILHVNPMFLLLKYSVWIKIGIKN
jgi:hypothetical protein